LRWNGVKVATAAMRANKVCCVNPVIALLMRKTEPHLAPDPPTLDTAFLPANNSMSYFDRMYADGRRWESDFFEDFEDWRVCRFPPYFVLVSTSVVPHT
jgi:hypothetical protein